MVYIVCYDIGFQSIDDKSAASRLRSVSKILCNYGIRRQRSVFECIIDKEMLESLKKELAQVLDRKQDSVRIYPMCDKCLKRTVVQGTGEIIEVKDFEIV